MPTDLKKITVVARLTSPQLALFQTSLLPQTPRYTKPSAKIRMCDAEALFKFLNSSDHELTLEGLIKLLWQSSLEEVKKPVLQWSRTHIDGLVDILWQRVLEKAEEPKPETKKRTMTVSKLTERLGLIETLIRLKNKGPTWCHLLFYFTSYVLNMFRTLI